MDREKLIMWENCGTLFVSKCGVKGCGRSLLIVSILLVIIITIIIIKQLS